MDWPGLKSTAAEYVRKYRYVALLLLAGLLLMALPEKQEPLPAPEQPQGSAVSCLEAQLEEILSRVKGAGKVEVLLTQRCGEEILYQTDSDAGDSANREDTVILTDSDREETGLVRQVLPPVYMGAVIVAQGGDSPAVKLAIVEAVMDVTGLRSHQITVLKMK